MNEKRGSLSAAGTQAAIIANASYRTTAKRTFRVQAARPILFASLHDARQIKNKKLFSTYFTGASLSRAIRTFSTFFFCSPPRMQVKQFLGTI